MIVVDEYDIQNFVESHYDSFGVYHEVQVYKHFHNPLITIFDRGNNITVVTFELEEFESFATLDRMLPIYARDIYNYVDPFVWYSLSDDEPNNFKAFHEMSRDHLLTSVLDRYEVNQQDVILSFLKSKIENGELIEASFNEVFQLIESKLDYKIPTKG